VISTIGHDLNGHDLKGHDFNDHDFNDWNAVNPAARIAALAPGANP